MLHFDAIQAPNICKRHFVEISRLLAVECILHEGRFLHSGTFLTAVTAEEFRTLDSIELLLLKIRHQELTADKIHDLLVVFILTGDINREVRIGVTISHRTTEFSHLLVEVLTLERFLAHDTCNLHQLGCERKQRHLLCADTITEREREQVVLIVSRVVQFHVLSDCANLDVVEVVEGLLEFTLRQFLELLSVRCLRVLHRIKRFDIRLRQGLRLLGLRILVERNRHVVCTEVFLRYACDLLFGEGLNLRIGREDIIRRFAVGESVNKRLHLR